MKKDHIFPGYLFAAGATALWSGNLVLARGLSDSIHPLDLAFWRWTVAMIVFLPFGLKSLIADWDVVKKNIPYLVITSILGVTIFNTLVYFAGQTTTAVNLSLISITFPVFIIILSRIFFGESITKYKMIGIVLVIAGVILLVTNGVFARLLSISFAIGDLWMLLAALTFAVYSLLLKRRPVELRVVSLQMCTFIIGLLFLIPFFIWHNLATPSVTFERETILSILYVGIFASLAAFFFLNQAIVKIGPTKAGMIYYTMPLLAGLLAFLFLGEEITGIHLFSAVFILSGILIANYRIQEVRELETAGRKSGLIKGTED